MEEDNKLKPVWSIKANIIKERIVEGERKYGTNKFRSGAKVFVIDIYGGMGGENVYALGHHKISGKIIGCSLKSSYLENFELKLIYHKKMLRMVKNYFPYLDGTEKSKIYMEDWKKVIELYYWEDIYKRKLKSLTLNFEKYKKIKKNFEQYFLYSLKELRVEYSLDLEFASKIAYAYIKEIYFQEKFIKIEEFYLKKQKDGN